jgi:hypothetical protein
MPRSIERERVHGFGDCAGGGIGRKAGADGVAHLPYPKGGENINGFCGEDRIGSYERPQELSALPDKQI